MINYFSIFFKILLFYFKIKLKVNIQLYTLINNTTCAYILKKKKEKQKVLEI